MFPDNNKTEAWCSREGRLQAQIPNTAFDGLAPSAFDPSLEYTCCGSGSPRPIFNRQTCKRILCVSALSPHMVLSSRHTTHRSASWYV